MSDADFDTLVALIETLIAISLAGQGHDSDEPRQKALARQRDEAVEFARSQLVL